MKERTHLALRPGIIADCTGALYLEASGTLLIADIHLGYAWAQRRRGELGPLTDGGVAERLRSVFDRWQPSRVVFAGDLVHLGRPSENERKLVENTLRRISGSAAVTIVLGNHDRNFIRDFGDLGLDCRPRWEDDLLTVVHGDREWPETDKWLVLGHLHPAIGLEDAAGVRQRLPVFVVGSRALVLPAFSPFAAGFDLRKGLSHEWRLLFGDEEVQLAAITGTQVRLLPRSRQLRFQRSPVVAP